MRSIVFASILVLAAGTGQLATAQELRTSINSLISSGGMTIQDVAAIFEVQSFTGEISSESELNAKAWGYAFDIAGYHCNSANRCTEFLFITGFDLPNGFPIEKINEWNVNEPAGRAFLDEDGDPFLDHTISVSRPGDSGAFVEGLILWLNALQDFDAYLDRHIALS